MGMLTKDVSSQDVSVTTTCPDRACCVVQPSSCRLGTLARLALSRAAESLQAQALKDSAMDPLSGHRGGKRCISREKPQTPPSGNTVPAVLACCPSSAVWLWFRENLSLLLGQTPWRVQQPCVEGHLQAGMGHLSRLWVQGRAG